MKTEPQAFDTFWQLISDRIGDLWAYFLATQQSGVGQGVKVGLNLQGGLYKYFQLLLHGFSGHRLSIWELHFVDMNGPKRLLYNKELFEVNCTQT